MSATNIPYADYGIAGVQTDAFTQIELFAGDTPAVVTDYGILGSSLSVTGIPAWTPVHVDPATRAITAAVLDADPQNSVLPNAITVVTIPAGTAQTSSVPVYKAGCFNVRALNWPASFDNAAKKFSAFAESADCQIYIKEPYGA